MLKIRRRILFMVSRRILRALLSVDVTKYTLSLAHQHLMRLPSDDVVHTKITVGLVRVVSTLQQASASSDRKQVDGVVSTLMDSFEVLQLCDEMKKSQLFTLCDFGHGLFYVNEIDTIASDEKIQALTHWAVIQMVETNQEEDDATTSSSPVATKPLPPSSSSSMNALASTKTKQCCLTLTLSVHCPRDQREDQASHRGLHIASEKAAAYKDNLEKIVHRTNQLLLLHSLHERRSCPNLLYVKEAIITEKKKRSTPQEILPKPVGMSLADFNAYREQYRSFRIGHAKGSKGELSQFLGLNRASSPTSSASPSLSITKSLESKIKKKSGENGMMETDGMYSCPIVYMLKIPLYERISPTSALNTISQSALLPFRVDNRKNMYVYRDQQGHIHYLLLSTTPMKEEKDSTAISSTTNKSLKSASLQKHLLILTAHGVDTPGKEITQDLCVMLQSKLNGHALTNISNLIGRNLTFQMTKSDLHFVCVTSRNPNRSHTRTSNDYNSSSLTKSSDRIISSNNKYPVDISTVHQSTMNRPDRILSIQLPSYLQNVSKVLHLLTDSTHGFMRRLKLSPAAAETVGVYDLALVYHSSPTTAIPSVGGLIGRGVAILHMKVLTKNNIFKQTNVGKNGWPDVWSDDLVIVKDDANNSDGEEEHNQREVEENSDKDADKDKNEKEDGLTHQRTTLKVKVWAAGRIDITTLMDRFVIHVHRAVHQYALETFYWKRPIHTCLASLNTTWTNPIINVMDSALTLGAANVYVIILISVLYYIYIFKDRLLSPFD